jgi:hypothetical protein
MDARREEERRPEGPAPVAAEPAAAVIPSFAGALTSPAQLLALQRGSGNAAVARFLEAEHQSPERGEDGPGADEAQVAPPPLADGIEPEHQPREERAQAPVAEGEAAPPEQTGAELAARAGLQATRVQMQNGLIAMSIASALTMELSAALTPGGQPAEAAEGRIAAARSVILAQLSIAEASFQTAAITRPTFEQLAAPGSLGAATQVLDGVLVTTFNAIRSRWRPLVTAMVQGQQGLAIAIGAEISGQLSQLHAALDASQPDEAP